MSDKKFQPENEKYQEGNECKYYQQQVTDIAIIGMSCRFPGAYNYEQFWENLKQGRSSIQEIPKERWDYKAFWGDPQSEINKSISKWGGFIADVDAFDAEFFNLSPREAEVMDPQQRIMLELTWDCLEDAGICSSQVSGEKVGVYIGVFNFDYKELQERKFRKIETYHSTGTASPVIANRISYYLNLKGPSIALDTACSGSLSAIHTAVQSLHSGECSMALAGGVSILLTPTRYISFSKTGMLSPTGSCKTFDESADGYVRGEGAGMILLKPLDQAIADGDSIYGILKGSAVNHNGKTHTLTYPSADAQADVIAAAHKQARVSPESISYIEAHGTGTPKGDPIEFQGLQQAFSRLTSQQGQTVRKNYCGLGSVKTNIGHLEAAAGIAGVIKVLLSMKYRQLPGLQNFKRLNHRIVSENSPFYFIDQLTDWPLLADKNNEYFPRRAGVSSFGFGGTNAHVVLEEAPVTARHPNPELPYYLICLSAKTETALRRKEKDLLHWLEDKRQENKLIDISATLLLGRENFEKRSAFVIKDVQELQEELKQVLEKGKAAEYFTKSSMEKEHQIQPLFAELGETIIKELQANDLQDQQEYGNKLRVLAELYVKGHNLNWKMIFPDEKIYRINLPTYPFARERFWISDTDTEMSASTITGFGTLASGHPLLQQNTSDFSEQRFSSTFTGQEFFLADHIVKGRKMLPAVTYLEMARAAVEQATGDWQAEQTGIRLKNVVWARPIAVEDQPVQVHIGLFPEDNGLISFEIYSEENQAEPVVHSQGSAVLSKAAALPALNLEELQAQCSQATLSALQCYDTFRAMGFAYGPGHQGIEKIYLGADQVLAQLSLPSSVAGTQQQFTLHPSLLDAALQASLGLLLGAGTIQDTSSLKLPLPFALQELAILGNCTAKMWAWIRYSESSKATAKLPKFDIDLCDGQGNICVRMTGFSSRVLEGELGSAGSQSVPGTLMLRPCWQEQGLAGQAAGLEYDQHLVMLCEPGDIIRESIQTQITGVRFLTVEAKEQDIAKRFQAYTTKAFEEIQTILKQKTKDKVLLQIVVFSQGEQRLFSGLSGLLKTAQLENPRLTGQLIEVEPGEAAAGLAEKLKENSQSLVGSHICYQDDKRYVASWREMEPSPEEVRIPWKDRGIYLITGGTGGLGRLFAREIAQQVKNATLILTGRSPLTNGKQAQLEELEALGACAVYRQTDVTQKQAVTDLITGIREEFGDLHGIIHSAGMIQDGFIIKKTSDELQAVLAPKVSGLVNLDQATKELALDFFILFSSVTGAFGNPGQCDYAAANAFMDAYATYRTTLVASGQRQGQTLSVNWPLWKDGGMRVDAETEKVMWQNTGLVAMQTQVGIRALYQGLLAGKEQMMVLEGDLTQIQAKLLGQASTTETVKAPVSIEENQVMPVIAQDLLQEKAIHYFKKMLASVIKLSTDRIDADALLEKYGIDSIMVMQLTAQLEKTFGSLPKTLFFEYQNIRELTGYFMEAYRDQLIALLGSKGKAAAVVPDIQDHIPVTGTKEPVLASHKRSRFASLRIESREEKKPLDIAIIGVAGRYPQARDIHEFWKNLREGKDCITEIPQDRWDHSLYFDEDRNKPGKTYSKWGGFIDGEDQFDPLFFTISPREAEIMDPQERLFLECVYETLEDAGYTREELGRIQGSGLEGNVGVFVGVMYEEYQLYGAQEQIQGRSVAVWGNPSSVANRVSYFCNFHGPSMAVDTMCSSSLTAIHLACQSLQLGKCEFAIAGGVNVSIHPNKYLFLGQSKFVSSKGRCESFGEGGDGYVPGEGVGAVLLKPLSKAIADGDHIYGIIKATSINHGGKTNGYTVPNPNAQASVIGQAFKEAGIDPRTISYLEAHGTGTSLGDPIEIAGLTKAFEDYTKDKQFCAIGSAKSNIGHCESAAGIAGVTKVLLQLKYRQLVPSLHSEVLNPHIDFNNTPFIVQQKLADWNQPVLNSNGEIRECSRMAGISSFGAGGANAHIVIEEYIPPSPEQPQTLVTPGTPAIIMLSAKSKEQLQEQVQRLLSAIEAQQITDSSLADMAYTLQVGREAMEERLAVLVCSITELEEKLNDFLEGKADIEDLYQGQVKHNNETVSIFTVDEELSEAVDKWISRKKYGKFLELWVKGLRFDCNKLYGDNKPRRISLPTYPFTRERYWIPEVDARADHSIAAATATTDSIHPLLHQNTSNLYEQRFTSTFTGKEFFLADHIIKGKPVLPGVACLEMARTAVEQAAGAPEDGQTGIRLQNVVWVRPIILGDQPVQVHTGIFPEDNGLLSFEIYSEENQAEPVVHSQGSAVLSKAAALPALNLEELQAQCSQATLSALQCYDTFRAMGFAYGPGHQGIEKIYLGADQVLAQLSLPSSVAGTQQQFTLHPSLLDAALQASLGLLLGAGTIQDTSSLKLPLPFALQELAILGNCTAKMWAWIRYSESSKATAKLPKFDIDLCDGQGNICVRMTGFSSRVLEGELGSAGSQSVPGTLMLRPCWQEQGLAGQAAGLEYDQHLVMLCEPGDIIRESIQTQITGVRFLTVEAKEQDIAKRFQAYTTKAFEEIQTILKQKTKDKVLLQIVVFSQGEQRLFSGLSGLLKTAQLENPRLTGQLIEVEPGEAAAGLAEKLKENSQSLVGSHICYQDDKRYVASWREMEPSPEEVRIPWKDRGIYLITGGTGGLGRLFAREIAQQVKNATLILTGRSPLTNGKQAQLEELEALGACAVYRQTDVTQKQAVTDLITGIREEFGDLHGIIHSAGMIQDGFIIKKTSDELQAVLAPKVSGLVNLDQATKELALDFFILFSSVTGAFGNPGQCDYAAANAFMDAYATYRTTLVASGQRQGQTLSVNWPLWKDGGMRVDAKIENSMRQNMGLVAMQTTTGIRALYQGIALGFEQMAIMEGDRKRLHEVFLGQSIDTETTQPAGGEQNKAVTAGEQNLLGGKVVDFLKQLFSSIIKLPPQRIEEDAPLEKYGIDSVMIMQLTNQLEKRFGSLPKTLFFEYQNIQELSEYFLQSYRKQLLHLFEIEDKAAATIDDPSCFAARTKPVKPSFSSRKRSRFISPRTKAQEKKEIGPLDIAIIGVSGRYPQADNMQEFWQNLRDGQDCITEIPPSRWDYRQYYTRNKDIAGTMYSKWGGFLADIDKFDPLLFNIAPLDAQQIDPQERLFMETVWETMEDAGYTKSRLREHAKVGVFAGVMWSEYQLLGGGHRENGVLPTQSFASIANRISYFYNFNGPSIALDTMCSSSLTAIYLACNSICHGDCEMAIAGGVSLSLHPNKYLQLCRNRFLSSDGRCRSFGEGGDGYVPGEGVGAVLLKPLQKAIADQDQIYAVIKDISINHGGKTNGYTVPNLTAQADLIAESLHKAQVDPRTITYIEAHGTGTSLGDPIEINGLTKAYHKFTQDKQYCAVGSVKSNIGHLEAAAGMAGLTKVLLQLKHKQIVPSLHSEKLNSNIEFDNSPFYVQQKLTEWTPITENKNGIFQTLPRRAAISSFGAGGANAHMILEEYQSITKAQECERVAPQIMLLSARTKACLYEYAKRLRDFCSNSSAVPTDNAAIADIAYTLQIGREPMEERMAIIGETWNDFIDRLTKFVNHQETAADLNTILYGCTAGLLPVLSKEQSREKVNVLIRQHDMEKLAALWVEGVSVPWKKLDHGNIISLPTYPFEQKSYWISAKDNHLASCGEPVTTGNQLNNQAGNLVRNEMEEIKEAGSNPNATMNSFDDENSLQQVIIDQYYRGEEEQSAAGFNEVQDLLTHVVAQELGLELEELNPEVDFEVYGLDSFARIKIINDLQKEFGDIVDMEVIFDQNTVNKLAGYINGKVNQHQPAAAEPMISNNRNAAGQNSKIKKLTSTTKQPSQLPADSLELKTKNILLTGVTGVLGGRLVWEYLNHSDSMLYCLLRAENLVQAKQRIQAMLEVHDPDHKLLSEFDRRVIPVLGDITHPSLEMPPELYQELAATIDMVVHCAGKTSLHGLYNEVKGVNIAGTQNMVNFALKTSQKYFIHISTIYGIMGDHQFKEGEVFTENDFDFGQQFNKLGYSQSKFEAEKIIRSTKDLKWIIMRSGYIMGDSKLGYYPFNLTNTPGIFYDFFKTAIELGMAIDNPWHFDITPIDYVSRSIVWLSMSVKNLYQTYHLSNPDYKTYKDIIAMIDKVGYPIRFVSAGEYMNNLHSENNSYRSISTELIMFNPSMVQRSHVDTTYTRKVLAQGGIICPEINEELIAVYLDYCSKVGYLRNSSSNNSFWNWQFQKHAMSGGM